MENNKDFENRIKKLESRIDILEEKIIQLEKELELINNKKNVEAYKYYECLKEY